MTRRTGRKWRTSRCGRCGKAHEGYSGKLDQDGIEYVVCGETNKRMNVLAASTDAVFVTIWERELMDTEEVDRHLMNSEVRQLITMDDEGYEDFITKLAKRVRDRSEAADVPNKGSLERGVLKWSNGVESDTHLTIVRDDDTIEGFALATRDSLNWTRVVTVDLGDGPNKGES